MKIHHIWWFVGLIVILVIGLYSIQQSREHWVGYFFPAGCDDKSALCVSQRIVSKDYPNEEACTKWGLSEMNAHSDPKDVFQCEENCQFYLGQSKCEKITRSFRTSDLRSETEKYGAIGQPQ